MSQCEPDGSRGFHGIKGSEPRVNPISARIMRGASTGGWFSSRRDGTIVARHEVAGITRKIAPSQRDD